MKAKTNIEEGVDRIIKHYGVDAQLGIAQEECAELIKAISKYKRAPGGYAVADLAEELADAFLMGYQIQRMLQIDDRVLQIIIDGKVKRQLERIEYEEAGCETN